MPERVGDSAERHFNRANSSMEAAEVFLLAPDARNLDRARVLLQDAIGSVIAWKSSDHDSSNGADSADRAWCLRRKARRIERLLQSAGEFMTGASLALGRLSAIYIPGGGMRQPDRIGLVSVEF